jgi:hypothetical protein
VTAPSFSPHPAQGRAATNPAETPVTALPPTPTAWALPWWDMYEERVSVHEIETGLDPHTARIRAEQEVRNWHRAGGDAALLAALPPLTQGTDCPLSARYERRPGSRGVAPGRASRR